MRKASRTHPLRPVRASSAFDSFRIFVLRFRLSSACFNMSLISPVAAPIYACSALVLARFQPLCRVPSSIGKPGISSTTLDWRLLASWWSAKRAPGGFARCTSRSCSSQSSFSNIHSDCYTEIADVPTEGWVLLFQQSLRKTGLRKLNLSTVTLQGR